MYGLNLLLMAISITFPALLSHTERSVQDIGEVHFEYVEEDKGHSRRLLSGARSASSKSRPPLTSSDISLCLIVKNEIDLEEWVSYHLALGVG